jgi:hypothetical protein
MPGLHQDAPRRLGLRWAAGALGLAVAAVTALAFAPASSASTTVKAQLSLSGVASQGNILGGTQLGVHPGDTVAFEAAAVPTAGLDNIPVLGPVLDNVVSSLLRSSYQVVLHVPAGFPGGKRDVALGGPASGPCKGAASLPVNFPTIGTYPFTWSVQYVLPNLLGCTKNNQTDLNLLKQAGIAINAANQWTGQIVVATNPPPPGISIQLPGVKVAPSLPIVGQLPTLSVPNINVPTIPVNVPSLIPTLPGGGTTSTSGGTGGGTSASGGGPGVECVPCSVVPHPGLGGGFGGPGLDAGNVTQLGSGLQGAGGLAGVPSVTATFSPRPSTSTTKRLDLAANKAPAAQVPVLLAIIAIIALSLVTATYARLYLLRRNA